MELILTDKAYRSILDECLATPKTETGGILMGKKIKGDRLVVPFALGPGRNPMRTRLRFSPDVEWQQVYLERLFNRYGVNYVGSYHRHPGYNCTPSFIDLKAARQIVFDPEWNVTEAVFPIINLADKRIRFHPYYYSQASQGQGLQLIDWHIISHKDKLIRHVLQKRNL